MIIDSHVHIGRIIDFDMPSEMVLESMEKYHIDFSFVSNIAGCEVDHDQRVIPLKNQFSQKQINEETLGLAKRHPDKIGALLWVKPVTEGCTPEFEQMIVENRKFIYGIKVHPYHSKLSFASEEVQGYIRLAEKYGLVIVTHTACDEESHPKRVYEMALKYPDVKFVMYHMGLATDNQDAISLIQKLPNLYGDSSWVKADIVLQAIKECGSHKILFGTDNPINGMDTYNDDDFYNDYFTELKAALSKEEYENFMYKNAIKLFGLE